MPADPECGPALRRDLEREVERLRARLVGMADELGAARIQLDYLRKLIVRHVEGTGNLKMREDIELVRMYREIKSDG